MYKHTHTQTYAHANTHTRTHTNARTHTHAHTHTRKHTRTHTHQCTHTDRDTHTGLIYGNGQSSSIFESILEVYLTNLLCIINGEATQFTLG